MNRLLIVDNEEYVVDGLVELFNGEKELELEVIGVYSSAEALNQLITTKIDIVLSDIRMPGLNGLELQKLIAKQWPRCKVIFLSGYDEFAYIQEAARVGMINYILKTEEDEVIIGAVREAIAELASDQAAQSVVQEAEKRMREANVALQREYFAQLMLGDHHALRTMREQFRQLSIPLSAEKPVVMVAGRVDEWPDGYSYYDKSLLYYAVKNISEEYLSLVTNHVCFIYGRSRLVWLIQQKSEAEVNKSQLDPKLWRLSSHFIYGTFECIQAACHNYLQVPISIAIGKQETGWSRLAEGYDGLRSYFDIRLNRELLLVEAEQPSIPGTDRLQASPQELLRQFDLLAYSLDNSDRSEFMRILELLLTMGRVELSRSQPLAGVQIASTITALLVSASDKLKLSGQSNKELKARVYRATESMEDWHELCELLRRKSALVFDHTFQAAVQEEDEIIGKIRSYIQQHLSGDITLKTVARVIGHNPSYLSRLYKQRSGQGLSEYVTELKLAKAKQLLRESNIRIGDISGMVGFLSEHYFYRFFKKAMNVTPQEFREQQKTEVNRRQANR
ncbi:response regulator [Paenibacillus sp. J5C_2022]|uniref:response regulator transcription factor n=1 Tax=Paenibacillus sp. J5C2022 TaxID=2977129 RepID=UPI0021CEACD5|nr:response regulator [Paenibacillus sp. J5C2022]MCU6707723.1 response regulator [Paenibacillus sp. J5C2022]